MNIQPVLLKTMTDEIFQPVRLYYLVHNMGMLLRTFGKLACMEFDPANDRWTWLYDDEAKSLKFENSYSSIPKERRPLILGSFYSGAADEMHLDIGSIERATKAVVFFNKYISRTVAEVPYAAIYNRLLPEAEHPGANFDKLFAGVRTEEIEARQEAEIERMTEMVKSGRLMNIMQERRFELVEAFPINFYTDGICQLEMALGMRQVVAFKRWEGSEDFSITDLLNATSS